MKTLYSIVEPIVPPPQWLSALEHKPEQQRTAEQHAALTEIARKARDKRFTGAQPTYFGELA